MKDGGQAFPSYADSSSGMSLRDYFAGQVLAGRCSMAPLNIESNAIAWDARVAYIYADAMLAERENGEKNGRW